MLARLATACLICMTLVLPVAALAAVPRAWVALSENIGVYAEAATSLHNDLVREIDLVRDTWQALFERDEVPPDIIITIGTAALDGVAERLVRKDDRWARIPVLAVLLPQSIFHARQSAPGLMQRPFSAAVLDQPIGRQLALLRRALPEYRRVGIVPGPQTQLSLGLLRKEAGERGIHLVVADPVVAEDGIYPALKGILDETDIVLALPDPLVFNAATLQNILLTTYRARVPLAAFSPAYTKAGAVIALHSTPIQVARRAADMLRVWKVRRALPPAQEPQEFSVTVNAKVAGSLGLRIDDPEQIVADLRRQEGTTKQDSK